MRVRDYEGGNQYTSAQYHVDISPSQVLDVFELLIQTYPRYADSTSREAAQLVVMRLIQHDKTGEHGRGVAEQILGRLTNEASRIMKCPK
jgi:hypothetical protein